MAQRRPDPLATVMRTRRTQTNEAGRCAVLLPALARYDEPLALIEVGASAGLTLLVDRYSYDYNCGDVVIASNDLLAPVPPCAVIGDPPLPASTPEICWRAGLTSTP